jgi:hypothetical protein
MNFWSYALANETRIGSQTNQGAIDSKRGSQGAGMENMEVSRFEEVHCVVAAKEAAQHFLRKFGHIKGVNSVADAVAKGLISKEQWCDYLDDRNDHHRAAKAAKLQRGAHNRYISTSLRYHILSQLEIDSPIHIDQLFGKIGGLRGSFRDQLMKMNDEGLVYFHQPTRQVRLTETGINELEYRRQQVAQA